jgi:hypothetical protein
MFVPLRPHRLVVRTPGFHPGNRGSIPLGVTRNEEVTVRWLFCFCNPTGYLTFGSDIRTIRSRVRMTASLSSVFPLGVTIFILYNLLMPYSELHSIRPSNWEMLTQEKKEVAESVTAGKNWSSEQFKKAMIVLSALKVPVPSYNRPESFDLGRMADFSDDLQRRTNINGREHSRLMLADWEANRFLAHGQIHIGTEISVKTPLTKQPGREAFQVYAGLLHTHPVPNVEIFDRQYLHLSGEDFRSLLTTEEMLFMLARYGDENLIALKTTATPNCTNERFDEIVGDLEQEFINNPTQGTFTQQTVKFTKHVCLETGLTLYRTPPNSSIAKREPVTK